jgi:blocked-early-in-transport protein 1
LLTCSLEAGGSRGRIGEKERERLISTSLTSFARQNDARNALFSNYDAAAAQSRSRPNSAASNQTTPQRSSSRNTHHLPLNPNPPALPNNSSPYAAAAVNDHFAPAGGAVYGAYNASAAQHHGSPYGVSDKKNDDAGFRSATPDRKGRYSNAVLESLESQNDDQAGEMSKKVKMLKVVSGFYTFLCLFFVIAVYGG